MAWPSRYTAQLPLPRCFWTTKACDVPGAIRGCPGCSRNCSAALNRYRGSVQWAITCREAAKKMRMERCGDEEQHMLGMCVLVCVYTCTDVHTHIYIYIHIYTSIIIVIWCNMRKYEYVKISKSGRCNFCKYFLSRQLSNEATRFG